MPRKSRAKADTNETAEASQAMVRVLDQPPAELPAILFDEAVPFPGAVVPIPLDSRARREAIHQAKQESGFLLLVNRDGDDAPALDESLSAAQVRAVEHVVREQLREESANHGGAPAELEPMFIGRRQGGDDNDTVHKVQELVRVGVVARLMRVVRLGDDRLSALVQLLRRGQLTSIATSEPSLRIKVSYPLEIIADEARFEAVYRQLRLKLQAFFEAHPQVSDELKQAALGIESPAVVADFVAQHLSRDRAERVAFLTELDLGRRMLRALEVTVREYDLLTVGNRISQEIRGKVEKHQREFLLREQLKSIRAELGEEKEPAALAIEELKAKLDAAKLPPEAEERAGEEMRRLSLLPFESPEHNVIRSYLEWVAALPWSRSSDERRDIARARQVLDADHYGLKDVKERILEFLAVHQLNPHKGGTLMCFSGPPGVGKTSLGQSIAKALGREFYRFSVGGMRDEAEIKGHRRTYIGALPGRILQALKQAKTNNPVIMLDELDKIGSDGRGDPSSALLEVLDPAQNKAFVDHYLDLPFDLSKVMFIATVNMHTELASALRDRLEVIELPGYIPREKQAIGERYLVPRQRKEHGLARSQLALPSRAVMRLIVEYTHEAGVRELERLIAKICRKRAVEVVEKRKHKARVAAGDIEALLGPPKVIDDPLSRAHRPGVAVGLAWTVVGGETLLIETAAMRGKGMVKVTGQLGDVMAESASLAHAFVRHNARQFGIDPRWFAAHDVHMHFPAGAVKKDGPSAGITATLALLSLITNEPVVPRLALTGEMTLRGEVLPVGGIREKVVAARRAKIKRVVLPARNRADVAEIPAEVRDKMQLILVNTFADVMAVALPKLGPGPSQNKGTARSAAGRRRESIRRAAKSAR